MTWRSIGGGVAEDVRQVFVQLKNDAANDKGNLTPDDDQFDATHQEKSSITIIGREVQVANHEEPVWQFRGIPYAEPPIGDLRFRRPVPKKYSTSEKKQEVVIDASTTGSKACIGEVIDGNTLIEDIEFGWNRKEVAKSMSEDCLYLNIWTRPQGSQEDEEKGEEEEEEEEEEEAVKEEDREGVEEQPEANWKREEQDDGDKRRLLSLL